MEGLMKVFKIIFIVLFVMCAPILLIAGWGSFIVLSPLILIGLIIFFPIILIGGIVWIIMKGGSKK